MCRDKIFSNRVVGLGCHCLYQSLLAISVWANITDHRPLTSLLSSKILNRRLHGMSLKLMEHDVNIVYRSGVANENADEMSGLMKLET